MAEPDQDAPESAFQSAPQAADGFDVCHVGVVLRAVLGVQGVLALGLGFVASGPADWTERFAVDTVCTLGGTLAWLVIVCALRRVLARLGMTAQWLVAMLLGAFTASLGWQLMLAAGGDEGRPLRDLSIALTGAACAGAMVAWLRSRVRAQQPADAAARLAELQSRIRPHFLFNTLNSAIALVRLDPQRAEGVLEDLSELFRVALADASVSVSLADEIELARRYLAIEQIRFGDRLRVQWQLDPEAGTARVPPLLLQPLVENAVRHGVEPNDAGGDVEVRTRRRGSEVELSIVNSVSAPARGQGHGMALANVRQRLMLMHDVAARFELQPEAQRFTVRMTIPR